MQQVIQLDNFEFTLLDDGQWLYKAVPFSKLKPVEKTQIAVVENIESEYKKLFNAMLQQTSKDIARYLDV